VIKLKKFKKILLIQIFIFILLNVGCSTTQKNENVVVVDSWGGMFQDAQREAFFIPFEKETGIKVIELSDGENIFAKVKAQVDMNNPNIDVVHADASWLGRGKKEDILYPINYEIIITENLYEDIIDSYGVGILYWSYNIAYNKNEFNDSHPNNWKEFWEWSDKNGKTLFNGGRPNHGIEAALMALGYPINKVYPLTDKKINQAFDLFKKTKNNFIWYTEGGQGHQLFADNECVLGEFFGGDIFTLADKGVPLGIEWNQGIYTSDYWLVPKNAPHKQNAMKFIEFTLRPEQQAKLAELTSYGPVNKKSFDFIDDEKLLKRLPSYPENKNKMLSFNHEWWGQHEDELLERWNNMLSS
jgi:putative spermidine/putrescine transport system substrate-binding protein